MDEIGECFELQVLNQQKILLKLKEIFYCISIIPKMLYETECLMVKSQEENKFSVTKISMVQWTSGYSYPREDVIKKTIIIDKMGVAFIVGKMVRIFS